MNRIALQKLLVLLAFFCVTNISAQKIIFVDNQSGLFTLEIVNGTCVTTKLDVPCTGFTGQIYSIALFKDTLYFHTNGGALYQSVIGKPGSCTFMTSVGISNTLTVDKNGNLYWMANLRDLTKYEPATGQVTLLGSVPPAFSSAGDLVFFKDKLYVASASGLVEINMQDPAQSTIAMSTPGYTFFGLVSVPKGCNQTTVYGLDNFANTSSLVELDIEKKQILNKLCSFPLLVYDAASITESGIVPGITLYSIDIKKQCTSTLSGSMEVAAYSAVPGVSVRYTLNGTETNTDGKFMNLAAGNYHLNISSSDGCTLDTMIKVEVADRVAVDAITTPDTCGAGSGTLALQKASGGNAFVYALHGGAEQTAALFSGLSTGTHQLKVKDENFCQLDTSIFIGNISPPLPVSSISIVPSSCSTNDGQINLVYSSPVLGARVDAGAFQLKNNFTGLAAGSYNLQIKTGSCLFDTVVVVPLVASTPPVISFSNKSPDCFTAANGSSEITISGTAPPYTISFNGEAYASSTRFTGLVSKAYPVNVKDANGCIWAALDTVPAYQPVLPLIQPDITHAECITAAPGKARLTITGPESPYSFEVDQQKLRSGSTATLNPGTYMVKVFTPANCLVDSVGIAILVQNSSGGNCDTVYMPNAFTPNGDGKNEILKPIVSALNTQQLIFRVYNRLGQAIFETRAIGKGWDGKIRGVAQPAGAYVWLVEHTNLQGLKKIYKGSLLLIR